MYRYYGNCITILDQEWQHLSATDMDQLVEEGVIMSVDRFMTMILCIPFVIKPDMSYWHNKKRSVAWIYDPDSDIHYFFGS
jgi:hypothetical protein